MPPPSTQKGSFWEKNILGNKFIYIRRTGIKAIYRGLHIVNISLSLLHVTDENHPCGSRSGLRSPRRNLLAVAVIETDRIKIRVARINACDYFSEVPGFGKGKCLLAPEKYRHN